MSETDPMPDEPADLHARMEHHAAPFLAGLLGCSLDDAWIQPVTFQTFEDKKSGGQVHRELAKVLHGSLDALAEELDHLNRAGAGVFVSVNGTDGRGRKKNNIVQLRAWWADLDDKGAWEGFTLDELPLAPSMRVRTPGGQHLYWLPTTTQPCETAERQAEHEAEVKAIARTLAPFGGDLNACDVARVLRVPGFYHHKAEPRLVELVQHSGPRCSRKKIRAAFPVPEPQGKPAVSALPPASIGTDRAAVLERAGHYLDTLPPGIQGQDGSGATFTAALKVQDGFDLTQEEATTLLLDRFNPRCQPLWSEEEIRRKVAESADHCTDRGHLLKEARHQAATALPRDGSGHRPEGKAPAGAAQNPLQPAVRDFEWNVRGLFHLKQQAGKDEEGNPLPPSRVWLAPPFTLPGLVRDDASRGWRVLMAWTDLDQVPHEEAIPFEQLSGDGVELARILGQGGMMLPPDPALRRLLLRYLCAAGWKVQPRVRTVDTLGWVDGAFVLPTGEVIGHPAEAVRFSGELPGPQGRSLRGTLEGWQQGVARFATENPRLAFALSCALAGPLLELVRPDGGGGFNLMGASSRGKSTCLECAASVWGRPDPLPTWRATSNGLEGVAGARNDGFIVLDELSQVDSKEAGSVAYMLANGSAKARATKEGHARAMRQWRLIFLSSGEQGLEDKLWEDGRHSRAGQEVRVPDIPCPPDGMFQDPQGLPSLGALAEHLKAQARSNYGHAARAFLEQLAQEWARRDKLQARLKEMESVWLASALPPAADAQVRRVAGRFALVAVAGELAQGMGIFPWPQGVAAAAAAECFGAWLERRGFTGSSENHRGVESVLAFIEKHGMSRFDEWGDKEARVINRAGTRRKADAPVDGWDYFMTPEAWAEATRGFQARDVARICIARGILESDAVGKAAKSVKIPGHGKVRAYVIRAAAIATDLEAEAV